MEKMYKISNEMIDMQHNDYVVKALNDKMELLKQTIHDTGLSGIKIYKDRRTTKIISEIDSIIFNRFGIKTKHIYMEKFPYGVLTVSPKNYNILSGDIEETYKDVEKELGGVKLGKENMLSLKHITSMEKDIKSVLYKWKEAVDSLEKKLNNDGIRIDLEKAKIFGLPDDYIVFMLNDFYLLTQDINLTPEELTAVLLHEVGHAFTYLEYSIRTVRNTSVLLDTIKENLEKDRSFKKSLLIGYEKLGGNSNELSNSNTITVFLTLMDRYMKSSRGIDENTHGFTDSEQLADQFAVRFGVALHLSTGLEKVQSKMKDFAFNIMLESGLSIMFFGTFWSIAITGTLVGGISLLGVTVVGIAVLTFFMLLLNSIITHGNQSSGQVYDYDKRRYMRIKNDLIRQLRKSRFPKELMRQYLNDIERITNLMEKIEPDEKQVPFIDKIVRAILPTGKELADNKKLDELVEDLMENDLYIASNKLKLIQG